MLLVEQNRKLKVSDVLVHRVLENDFDFFSKPKLKTWAGFYHAPHALPSTFNPFEGITKYLPSSPFSTRINQ